MSPPQPTPTETSPDKEAAADAMQSRGASLLDTLGLGSRQARAWAAYDWANSAFATVILAAVFPIFYRDFAGVNLLDGAGVNNADLYWSYTQSIGLAIVAILAPILGAVADFMGAKKRFLGFFVVLGVIATASLFMVERGDWLFASAAFIVAFVGFAGANVFYDALLPHVTAKDRADQLSSSGYALGYMGGGLLLLLNLGWILAPERFGFASQTSATQWALVSVAVWWALFSLPLFRLVPEPPRALEADEVPSNHAARPNPLTAGFTRLADTFRTLKEYRQLLLFLAAFWLYADGIGTIVKMATIYGRSLGLGQGDLIGALVLTQFAGIPFAFAFGLLAQRIGAKRSLYLGLSVYAAISVGAYFLQYAWQFWVMAFLIATVQGGTQAISRSVFSSMAPAARSSEFFGFFSVSAKFAGILGPLVFAFVRQTTGDPRNAIFALIVFFLGGMAVLSRVDIEEGQRVAREEDARFLAASSAG